MRSPHSSILGSGLLLALVFSCSQPPIRPTNNASADLKGNHPGTNGPEEEGEPETGAPAENGETPGDAKGEPETGEVKMPEVGEKPGDMVGEPAENKDPKYSLLFVSGGSEEIKVYKFDKKTGAASLLKSHALPGINATFLAVHPATKMVFGADEKGSNALMMSLDPATGELKDLSKLETAGGPAHVSVDAAGKNIFVANYGAGAVDSFAVGNQGLVAKTRKSPGKNAHSAQLDLAGKNLFVPCLGSGVIAQFTVDATGALSDAGSLEVGSKGPRHLAFHPNGKFVYLMNEYDGYVQALSYDGKSLKLNGNMVASTMSPVAGNTGAEIQVHPNGKFLYSSNRGDDSIAIYSIGDAGTVTLQKTVKSGGKVPRHFAIDASGKWMTVANQDSNNVTVFQIDADSGALTAKAAAIDYKSAQYAEIFDFY